MGWRFGDADLVLFHLFNERCSRNNNLHRLFICVCASFADGIILACRFSNMVQSAPACGCNCVDVVTGTLMSLSMITSKSTCCGYHQSMMNLNYSPNCTLLALQVRSYREKSVPCGSLTPALPTSGLLKASNTSFTSHNVSVWFPPQWCGRNMEGFVSGVALEMPNKGYYSVCQGADGDDTCSALLIF